MHSIDSRTCRSKCVVNASCLTANEKSPSSFASGCMEGIDGKLTITGWNGRLDYMHVPLGFPSPVQPTKIHPEDLVHSSNPLSSDYRRISYRTAVDLSRSLVMIVAIHVTVCNRKHSWVTSGATSMIAPIAIVQLEFHRHARSRPIGLTTVTRRLFCAVDLP